MLNQEEFFKHKLEECRELATQAVNADDRIFWQQAAAHWEERLAYVRRPQPAKEAQRYAHTRRVLGKRNAAR